MQAKTFKLTNTVDKESYTLQFESGLVARMWIDNNLDVSKDWSYKQIGG